VVHQPVHSMDKEQLTFIVVALVATLHSKIKLIWVSISDLHVLH